MDGSTDPRLLLVAAEAEVNAALIIDRLSLAALLAGATTTASAAATTAGLTLFFSHQTLSFTCVLAETRRGSSAMPSQSR